MEATGRVTAALVEVGMAKVEAAAARAGSALPRPAVAKAMVTKEGWEAVVAGVMDSAVEVAWVVKMEVVASVVGRLSTGKLVGMGRWEEVEIVDLAEALPAAASPAVVARVWEVVQVGAEAIWEVLEVAAVGAAIEVVANSAKARVATRAVSLAKDAAEDSEAAASAEAAIPAEVTKAAPMEARLVAEATVSATAEARRAGRVARSGSRGRSRWPCSASPWSGARSTRGGGRSRRTRRAR